MENNTNVVVDDILNQGEALLKELCESIENKYVNLTLSNFKNLVVLAGEYSKYYVIGEDEKCEIKKESMNHAMASVISVLLTAAAELVGESRIIVYNKISELIAYLSTHFLVGFIQEKSKYNVLLQDTKRSSY